MEDESQAVVSCNACGEPLGFRGRGDSSFQLFDYAISIFVVQNEEWSKESVFKVDEEERRLRTVSNCHDLICGAVSENFPLAAGAVKVNFVSPSASVVQVTVFNQVTLCSGWRIHPLPSYCYPTCGSLNI